MSLFDKLKKIFGAGDQKPEQVQSCKSEPAKKPDSPSPSVRTATLQKKPDSPSPSVRTTGPQNNPSEPTLSNFSNLPIFLELLRLDMLVCYGVYNLNLDPDDDNAFVSLDGFGAGMSPAYTLYGAYKDIDRRMGGNWSFVKARCIAKNDKLSPIAKSPFFQLNKWEEIRKTVMMDMLKDTGSNAQIDSDINDKKHFYSLCAHICTTELQKLQSSAR